MALGRLAAHRLDQAPNKVTSTLDLWALSMYLQVNLHKLVLKQSTFDLRALREAIQVEL